METFETFTYALDGNLYINLTSKCSNDCTFCVRNEHSTYFGHKLWLSREPSAQEVIARLPAPQRRCTAPASDIPPPFRDFPKSSA